ncbi:MAG: CGNR zinc finger domain-containing protein [Bacteroidales bacterium]
MKTRIAESTGRPEPQFILETENNEEHLLVKMFLRIKDHSKEKLVLHLHGYQCGEGHSTFNFGWIAEPEKQAVITEDVNPSKVEKGLKTQSNCVPEPKDLTKALPVKVIMIKCHNPRCNNEFVKSHSQKYCSKKCGQSIHNANYTAKHTTVTDKNVTKQDIFKNHPPIDPPQEFHPDPEPSGEFDGPF